MLIFMTAGIVFADVTVPVTPKNLPKTDATLTFTYSGEVTGLTVVTPDGRTLSGAPAEAGTISIYLGDAPSGKYMLTIAGTFTTFQVSVSGSTVSTTTSPTTTAPAPSDTVAPTQSSSPPTTESGSVATPTPTPTMAPLPSPTSQTATTSNTPAVTIAGTKETSPSTATTVTVVPLPIITEETTEETTAITTEASIPADMEVAPTQDKIDEFISTNIPTPQILVETESYFSLLMIYAVIPLIVGGILGGGSYMAFGFYSIYNRKKRRLKQEEEEIIQF